MRLTGNASNKKRRRPMPLGGLQHFTIEPQDLERTKDFYVDVLGLEIGDRPPLDFPGYWLYSGGTATVHLMGTRKPREGIVVRGIEKKYDDTGRLDHIAFAATDVDGVRKRLQSKNVKFRESIVPRTGDTQFFMYDPDGVGDAALIAGAVVEELSLVAHLLDDVVGRIALGAGNSQIEAVGAVMAEIMHRARETGPVLFLFGRQIQFGLDPVDIRIAVGHNL